ncbi:MAG: diacylglycerol kinase family protein [Candidatus Nanopelagicales bacterium]
MPPRARARGKSAPELGTLLHRRGIDAALLVAGSADEALQMARKAVSDGVDANVAAGGDGTININLAIQAVAGTDTLLARSRGVGQRQRPTAGPAAR